LFQQPVVEIPSAELTQVKHQPVDEHDLVFPRQLVEPFFEYGQQRLIVLVAQPVLQVERWLVSVEGQLEQLAANDVVHGLLILWMRPAVQLAHLLREGRQCVPAGIEKVLYEVTAIVVGEPAFVSCLELMTVLRVQPQYP